MAPATELSQGQKEALEILWANFGGRVGTMIEEQFDKLLEKKAAGRTNRMAQLLGGGNGSDVEDPNARITPAVVGSLPPPERGYKLGTDIGRFVRALAIARADKEKPLEVARRMFGKDARYPSERVIGAFQRSDELKDQAQKAALGAQGGAIGGFLLPEELAAEVIEFLRPASAVRMLSPVTMPMDVGTLRVPKLATGASAAYVGENINIATAQPVFGQVVLSAKKLAALVPLANDLIRRGGPQVDALIRDDLVAAIAQRSDLAFIRGDGTSGQPKGLLNWALSAEQVVSNATVNAVNVVTDLGKIIQALADANVRFVRPGWLFSNRTWRYLFTLLSTTNQFIFRDEMIPRLPGPQGLISIPGISDVLVMQGTLFGFPYARTAQIPNNLAPGTGSEIYLVDFADMVIGETTGILVDVSTEAAYFDGAQVQATFSLDQMVVRALVEHDVGMRHNESVAMLQQVLWN